MNKKVFFLTAIVSAFCAALLTAQESVSVQEENAGTVPLLLEGIWSNRERYVVFDSGFYSEGKPVMQNILRVFHSFYDDRAAESSEYTEKHPRDVNQATAKRAAEEITVHFHPLTEQLFTAEKNLNVVNEDGTVLYALEEPSGAWDMEIKYPGFKETYHVPLCVIGNELYLDFAVKSISYAFNENPLYGFFKDEGKASGITINPPVYSKELSSYFVSSDAVYTIRYWRTDMEYDGVKTAQFSDQGATYEVPKHLKSFGETFTCVNGRGTKIRNIEKSPDFSGEYKSNRVHIERTVLDEDGGSHKEESETCTIVAFGKPYLTLLSVKEIEEILRQDAEKRPPQSKPLFPPHGLLDFDWSVLDSRLEAVFRRMFRSGTFSR
ncbi:MAG: hypothetical protein J5780_05515 [Treponema sp.]|nr:hypothetical protein [Treponema sp.]